MSQALSWGFGAAGLQPCSGLGCLRSEGHGIPAGANAVSLAVIRLVQVDKSRYPFSAQPPVYIRAQLYKYWFTSSAEGR